MKTSILSVAPARLIRGEFALAEVPQEVSAARIFAISGTHSRQRITPFLEPLNLDIHWSSPIAECSESALHHLQTELALCKPTIVVGIGGGKVLDAAKWLGDRAKLPVMTIPTSAATCAAWTALSNIYSPEGAFAYDVPLSQAPQWMIVDYRVLATAPMRTLIAGIGDALAKWYEASVSSGHSDQTLIISAVQAARVLRDILFQKAKTAIEAPGSGVWREVVDASVCLAGVIGGMGGAQCRTVAAHAIHNGLTHLPACHDRLHGEKVAFGILVQLRLEEFHGNQLAASARQQLLKFYREIGLPCALSHLHLADVSLRDLEKVATIACQPKSDIHHLPFVVSPEQVVAAMVSTTAPLIEEERDRTTNTPNFPVEFPLNMKPPF